MASCDPKPIGNQEVLKKEIESRKIKRVSKIDIVEAAMKVGDSISIEAKKTLVAKLSQAIASGGIKSSFDEWASAIPSLDSLSKAYHAEIKRVGLASQNQADSLELEILQAYKFALSNKIEIQPNLQEVSDEVLLYTKPMLFETNVCRECHGSISVNHLPENHEGIKSLILDDTTANNTLNKFHGMWSIRLSKKEIIKGL